MQIPKTHLLVLRAFGGSDSGSLQRLMDTFVEYVKVQSGERR